MVIPYCIDCIHIFYLETACMTTYWILYLFNELNQWPALAIGLVAILDGHHAQISYIHHGAHYSQSHMCTWPSEHQFRHTSIGSQDGLPRRPHCTDLWFVSVCKPYIWPSKTATLHCVITQTPTCPNYSAYGLPRRPHCTVLWCCTIREH